MVRSWLKRRQTRTKEDSNEQLETISEPASAASEAYRVLRTNLLHSFADASPQVMVLTTPEPGEDTGKICANLAVALTQADKHTLIVDCDLRKPTVHRFFELRNFRGLVDILRGECSLQEVWQEPLPGLKVLAAGPTPPNPADLLESRRFADVLDQARQECDYVLVNAPPLNVASEALILAAQGDGVLLLLGAHRARKEAVRRAVQEVQAARANILGTVLYDAPPSRRVTAAV